MQHDARLERLLPHLVLSPHRRALDGVLGFRRGEAIGLRLLAAERGELGGERRQRDGVRRGGGDAE